MSLFFNSCLKIQDCGINSKDIERGNKMRKYLVLIFAVLLLTACSSKELKESDLDMKELLDNVAKANESVKSIKHQAFNEVIVTAGDEGIEELLETEQYMDFEAKAMEQHIKDESSLGEDSDIIIYTVDGEVVIFDNDEEEWHPLSASEAAPLLAAAEDLDINELMGSLIDLADWFTVYEDGDSYVASIDELEVDEYTELLERLGSDLAELFVIVGDDADIDKFEYNFRIDAETYLAEEVNFYVYVSFVEGEEDITYEETSEVIYSDYNAIDPIEIPAEARE